MVLFHGANGQGKSNLLEALYMLTIAKSHRASTDREMIRWQATHEHSHSRILAVVERDPEPVRLQIDFQVTPQSTGDDSTRETERNRGGPGSISTQKYIRVNGVPRRASDLVGQMNAVMFSAEDLELVYGSPTVRRRYIDILISQLDHAYLRTLQRYQKVVTQRNHLLRQIREGTSRPTELAFWDDELINEGTHVIAQRMTTLRTLTGLAAPIHQELTGTDSSLSLEYQPSVAVDAADSPETLAENMRASMEANRRREIAQGVTVFGPHRDDLQILIDGMDAGTYASRGQTRTAVLAMKLAEAQFLRDQRRQEPILLLDDVLSELDATRRAHVLKMVSGYQQCFITTADLESIEERYLVQMARYAVKNGRLEFIGPSTETTT